MRGNIYFQTGELTLACQDWESAAKLGSDQAQKYIESTCTN
jgi:hypothetical protein